MKYSKHYINTFKKFQEISDTECIITLSPIGSQVDVPIFKIKGIPSRKVYTNSDNENNISSIMFVKETIENSYSENYPSMKFPLKDISNRVAKIRFNGVTYTLDTKDYNMFYDIIRFNVSTSI